MTTQKVRTSDIKLFNAFVKLLNNGSKLENISTRHLIAEAGISKSTFYRHYTDKYAFYNWVANYLLSQLQEAVHEAQTPLTFYQRYFKKCQTYRQAYKAFIINNHWLDFEQELFDKGMNNYRTILSKTNQPGIPVDSIASYIVAAHVGIAVYWLRTDDASTPDELADRLTRLTTGALAAFNIDFVKLFQLR